MKVKSLELTDFRNYDFLSVEFDDHTNLIYGDNAQGKTNILESLFVCATSKSHKGAKDKEMIHFEKEEAHIKSLIERGNRQDTIDIHLRKGKKKSILINKVPLKKASDLFGIMHVVFFSPEDLNLIKNSPSERRRFLDQELCQLDKIYLSDLVSYNKALQQRNQLLKDIYFHPDLKETLDVWDEKLIQYGKSIIRRREEFLLELNDITREIHTKISGGKEVLKVTYEPNVIDAFFKDELISHRQLDLKTGSTSVGPHRDDISFEIENVDLRKYGSQGQQRSAALSLKLSELELVEHLIHERPILLLDDVMSELDSNRQKYLLESLEGTQTIITCTGLDEFVKNNFHGNKVFYVEKGKVVSHE